LLDLTNPGAVWPDWLRAFGCATCPAHARLLFDSIQAMYQAASNGLGLALGFNPLVDPFLTTGGFVLLENKGSGWLAPIMSRQRDAPCSRKPCARSGTGLRAKAELSHLRSALPPQGFDGSPMRRRPVRIPYFLNLRLSV
jgi:DNA-binding transcriptional LysR family regulator